MGKRNKKNKNKKNKGGIMFGNKNITEIGKTSKTIAIGGAQSGYNAYDVYGNYRYGYGYGYYGRNYEKPTELKEYNKVNYVVMNQEVLNEIMNACLPKAGGSEFQFHYWALQAKISSQDGRKFAFTFPLAFFNFKQTVTSGSVDFNLPEVDAEAEKVKPAAKELAKALIKSFPKKFFVDRGFSVKFEFGDIGSIHRHPGRFGFSSIDLRYDPMKPGVIFRNKEGHDLWQTDSVLYCADAAELVTTETRVFNIAPVDPNDEDKGSKGTVAEIPTLMLMIGGKEEEEISTIDFSDFFGAKKENPEIKNYYIKKTMKAPEIDEAINIAKAIGEVYKPLNFVDPNKIEQRYTGYYYSSKNTNTTKAINAAKDSLWDYYGELYDYEEKRDVDFPDVSEVKIETNSFLKEDLTRELMELAEIPDPEKLDENVLWDLAKDHRVRVDLFDLYNYYCDYKDNILEIKIGSGKLELNENGVKMFIGDKLVYQDKWRI